MHYLSLWDWLNSFSAMPSGFIHVAACCKISSFMAEESWAFFFFFSFSEYSPSLVCYFYFDRSNTPNLMQSESKNKLFRSTVKHQHQFQIPIIGI